MKFPVAEIKSIVIAILIITVVSGILFWKYGIWSSTILEEKYNEAKNKLNDDIKYFASTPSLRASTPGLTQYLYNLRPHYKNTYDDYKNTGSWKKRQELIKVMDLIYSGKVDDNIMNSRQTIPPEEYDAGRRKRRHRRKR